MRIGYLSSRQADFPAFRTQLAPMRAARVRLAGAENFHSLESVAAGWLPSELRRELAARPGRGQEAAEENAGEEGQAGHDRELVRGVSRRRVPTQDVFRREVPRGAAKSAVMVDIDAAGEELERAGVERLDPARVGDNRKILCPPVGPRFSPWSGPKLRQARRASLSQPMLARLRRALVRLKTQPRFLPQSLMGQAIGYALNQRPALLVFLADGRLEIENNLIENAIRPTAIGKKELAPHRRGPGG